MHRLAACVLVAPFASAQPLFREAPPEVPGPFRRVAVGRFTGMPVQDVAVLTPGGLFVVCRPLTWGSYHATGVADLVDIARLPRVAGASSDLIVGVGGGNPRLISVVDGGFCATDLLAPEWVDVRRIDVACHGTERRIVGVEAGGTVLRFGSIDPFAATLTTHDTRVLGGTASDIIFANWDEGEGDPEVVVATTNGLEVYGWEGGAARASVPRVAAQSRLARLSLREAHHLVWMHRPQVGSAWTLETWAGGAPRHAPMPPPFAGVIAADVDIINLAACDVDAEGPDAFVEDLLVYHNTSQGPQGNDAVVLRYRPLSVEQPYLNAMPLSARPPAAADECRMAFADVDGDLRGDSIRATSTALGLAFAFGASPRPEIPDWLIDFDDQPYFQTIKLRLAVALDCLIRVRAWHQPDRQAPVLLAAALTEGYVDTAGYFVADLPPHTLTVSPGIFYLEVDFLQSNGEASSVMYPYIPEQPGQEELLIHAEEGVLEAGPSDLPSNRNLSVVKRPIFYKILPPPTNPPVG